MAKNELADSLLRSLDIMEKELDGLLGGLRGKNRRPTPPPCGGKSAPPHQSGPCEDKKSRHRR